MTTKKFLTSVANVYAYNDATDTLLFTGKTLLDSSIETTLGNTDVRGGYGNQLEYVYYHTSAMNITISDSQWNLDFLSKAVGDDIIHTGSIFYEENVTLVANAGSVTYTPLQLPDGTAAYGWVTIADGSVERVAFSTKAFTASTAAATETVCVRYYADKAAIPGTLNSITINANMIPSIVHLVLEAQLNSPDSTVNKIGTVQIDIPKATLTGAFSIKMTPDGVATTPLAARALSSEGSVAGCNGVPFYATIKEIITSGAWYDDVIGLSIEGGDFTIVHPATKQLHVWAIPSTGLPFTVADTGITYALTSISGDTGISISATGLVTALDADTGVVTAIHATIGGKPAIDATVLATLAH